MFHLTVFSYLQAFAQLLQAPNDDAQMIIRERFPVPRLVVCDQHGSQVSTLSTLSFALLQSLIPKHFVLFLVLILMT